MVLGYIHFDTPGSNNYVSEVLTLEEYSEKIFLHKYVKVSNPNAKNDVIHIGRIIEGPFYLPEEVGRSSAIAQTPILYGEEIPMIPRYYGLERIEILGEYRENKLYTTKIRPKPKSKVEELDIEDIKNITGGTGDIFLGKMSGYPDLYIYLDSKDKKVLPRNIGIFGTVGSGKSNTAQVLIEELLEKNYAVVLFDVEGEYVNMDKKSIELLNLMSEYNISAKGVSDFNVYYPYPAEKPTDKAKPFCVKFENTSLYILLELIHATEAQERYLSVLIDEIEKERCMKNSKKEGPMSKVKLPKIYTLSKAIQKLYGLMDEGKIAKSSGYALSGKLAYVNRLKIFDIKNIPEINVDELVVSGRLSVIDVSSCSDHVKNIVIVDILNKIFNKKIDEKDITKTLIAIEEAHTFISKEHRDRMEATIDLLKVIARRGRKRWLALCFISQQPSHIPNEIFELCNTRIVHCIKSDSNINALKNTTGGVISEIWNDVPALGQGEALVITPQFTHPIYVNMRPAESRSMFIE